MTGQSTDGSDRSVVWQYGPAEQQHIRDANRADDRPDDLSFDVEGGEVIATGSAESIRWLYDYLHYLKRAWRNEGEQWDADAAEEMAESLYEQVGGELPERQRNKKAMTDGGQAERGTEPFDGAAGMTARENLPRDAVAAPERDLSAVTGTLTTVSEGQQVKLGIAVNIDGEDIGGTSVMDVYGVETDPPNFDRRVNLLHHDGIANRLWITGTGNDGLDPWEIVSAPYDPVRGVLDSRDMAFHGWVVGAEVVETEGSA